MFNFRTDLAVERRDIFQKNNNLEKIDGIETEEIEIDKNLKVSRVKITNENGEQAIGKPIGDYITVDIKKLRMADEEQIQKSAEALSKELKPIIDKHIGGKDEILVAGLGNIYVTPDSLGPKVVNDIDVTRHIIKYLPQYVEEGTREVSAVSPGVLGTTGIETTIQLSDTGIVPGAGVGNTRKELSKKTLGIPVVAIGIPTVVESAVLVNDCLDLFITKLQEEAKSNEYLNELKAKDNYEEIKEALNPSDYNMIVTPKEIDELIENMASIVARGINISV